MKNKIYNFIIAVLVIAVIVVIALIVIRYGRNYLNEKDVSASLTTIEEEIQKDQSEDGTLPELEFKGYKIEGIIEIPKINKKYPIIDHTDDEAMKVSITKFCGPQPNEIGNYVVAGHNNKDGTMFGDTKYLEIGDIIKITNLKNETIEYEVFDMYTIDPDDLAYTENVEPNTREVTLITCTNGHKNRLITKARQKI